ncbi:MAG: DUF5615 family PIN-like protein [Taibaiella sp.]|nr:DUF5615 family PIN-like protein [Taibaiella sp.]
MQPDWEIWLDVHLSPVIAKWLGEYTGYKVVSAYKSGITNLNDKEIFLKAKQQGNVIVISKDTDFPELISYYGAPPKLIYIRKGNCDNKELWAFIKQHIDEALKLLTEFNKTIIELE